MAANPDQMLAAGNSTHAQLAGCTRRGGVSALQGTAARGILLPTSTFDIHGIREERAGVK